MTLDGTLTFTLNDDPTADNIPGNYDWDISVTSATGTFDGAHTAGTVVVTPGAVQATGTMANTVFEVKTSDIADGNTITIDGVTVTLAVGKDSTIATKDSEGKAIEGVIDLTNMSTDSIDLDLALSKISEGFAEGTENFIVGVNNTGNGDVQAGLTVHKKDDSKETYDTKEKLGGVFSINAASTGKALTLQIGDTADSYNQLKVNIADCHTSSLGIADISIANQEDAQSAVDAIKKAINYVSDVCGTLGATQNRLDHTINNLSVMTENIQDAESIIRDVDVAEEMMAYTKNNILIQASQAMLAQANQVPQGVLQLLQ